MKLTVIPLVYMLNIFVVNCLRGSKDLLRFTKDARIVGKTCPDNKVFTAQNIQSMFVCSTMCSQDDTCASFFFSSSTGRCDGCKLVYSNNFGLKDRMEGSLYYKRAVNHSYLGCIDTFTFNVTLITTDMTVELCADFCISQMTMYPNFILDLGTHCHCAELSETYNFVSEASCNFACGGDANQICGAFFFDSVYAYH